MFYPRDVPLLTRHTTSSPLASLNGDGNDVLTSGVELTKRIRHLEELGSCHSPRPAPRLWRRSRFAILTATWAGERQRAAASRRTAHSSHKLCETHLKPACDICAFNGNPPTYDRLRGQSYIQAQ
ncbi:uncharacterized protein BXZ73DRAFT_106300 [Epithele typhae]|uniref:uncharacterized protein n=1 Tax=Epithele typhae TaxID=378194 RepID=UPI0020087701|nr:uncharacterized protein BXZ73DRAFT_106300 [Epithele typhae]KAH9915168.1 hypothetical protein BXZ73DRAFT_106300 [Epithele typhae]